ncbi:MAG: hypothetical protein IJQ21_08615 [Lachnospiraceae bacterium]|nr:hypothetical protein [Lachnospiraceae bacterium]
MKTSRVSLLRITAFLAVLVLLIGATNEAFRVKYEETKRIDSFYALEKQKADVLVIGNSHAFWNFYTNVLWDEYGMASFIMAAPWQPMWNAHFYLKEALKTQTPKLVILEGHALTFDYEYDRTGFGIYAFYGMRPSRNKWDAIHASTDDESQYVNYLLEFPIHHTRYNELRQADFRRGAAEADFKGTYVNPYRGTFEKPDIAAMKEKVPLHPKAEEWFRKTLQLAADNNIPICVVIAPFIVKAEEQGRFLTAEEIAAEYDVPFLNYNTIYDRTGMDFTTATSDEHHLNYISGPVFTRTVAEEMKERYDIPDRRDDASYASWQRDADLVSRRIHNCMLKDFTDYNELLRSVRGFSYDIIVTFNGNAAADDAGIAALCETAGIDRTNEAGIRYIRDGAVIAQCLPGGEAYVPTDQKDFYLESTRGKTGMTENRVLLDHEELLAESGEDGVHVIVYDTVLQEVAVSFKVWRENGYNGFEWTDPQPGGGAT